MEQDLTLELHRAESVSAGCGAEWILRMRVAGRSVNISSIFPL